MCASATHDTHGTHHSASDASRPQLYREETVLLVHFEHRSSDSVVRFFLWVFAAVTGVLLTLHMMRHMRVCTPLLQLLGVDHDTEAKECSAPCSPCAMNDAGPELRKQLSEKAKAHCVAMDNADLQVLV